MQVPAILDLLKEMEANRSISNTNVGVEAFNQLLANWFFDRHIGTFGTATARLVFSSNTNVFSVKKTDVWILNDSKRFSPAANINVLPNLYVFTTDIVPEYYIEIPIVALDLGSANSPQIGDRVTSTPYTSLLGYKRGLVSGDVVPGTDSEGNDAALSRLQEDVSVKNLINVRSINSQLSSEFPGQIQDVLVVGFMEPEMYRDVVEVSVPINKAMLFFSAPVELTLPKISTKFYYDKNPAISYVLKQDLAVSGSDPHWTLLPQGYYKIEMEVELEDLDNLQGFGNDTAFSILVAGNDIATSYPLFLSARSKASTLGDNIIHMGSFTDIYVRPAVVRTKEIFRVPTSGLISIPDRFRPILSVHAVRLLDASSTPVDVFDTLIGDPDKRFTYADDLRILVNEGFVGVNVEVEFSYVPLIPLIENFVNDPLTRITDSHTLVKMFNPIFVSVIAEVEVDGGIDSTETVLKGSLRTAIESLPPDSDISSSLLINAMHTDLAALSHVRSINLYASQIMPDGNVVELIGTDIISPTVDLSQGVSRRTCTYVVDRTEIIFA